MSDLTVEEQIVARVAGAVEASDTPPPETEENGEQQPEAEPQQDDGGQLEPEGEPEPTEAEQRLAGRFKTVEDLERGYEELNRKLGEQAAEVGDFRRMQEELAALREQLQPQQQQAQYDPGSIDMFLAENPQQIPALAQQAIDSGDGYLYNRALAAWAELDPLGATRFDTQQVVAAQMQQIQNDLKPSLESLQRVETTSQLQAAWDVEAAKHDDFAAVLSSITQETLDGFPPENLALLQSGSQASKEHVLEMLYRWQKAGATDNLNAVAAQAVAQQQESNRQARADAQVAAPSGAADRTEPEPRSAFLEAFEASDAYKKAAGLI